MLEMGVSMSEERDTWEIRIGVHATEEQVRELIEKIKLLLCPVPEHAGPCPVPWATGLVPRDAFPDGYGYPELEEQFRIEHGHDDA
ncbi:hypothetical protein F4559_002783 [Saccharothrix violaceirubra]|uniref:Uncharacterized protein n=2 Tax=Saccharothrix violaceirubra TaxID=413306 RepID=A0A7W7T2M3_9PSEU|nr:hypothetical protein [Saccharothrix violaceirubra]